MYHPPILTRERVYWHKHQTISCKNKIKALGHRKNPAKQVVSSGSPRKLTGTYSCLVLRAFAGVGIALLKTSRTQLKKQAEMTQHCNLS